MKTEQEVTRWYKTVEWLNVRDYVIRKNPLCQFVDDDGKQCDQASRIVHHIVDPKDAWELRAIWSNLVAVCALHHQGGQRGETQGYRYAPTLGPDPGYGCEQEVFVHEVKSTELVPTGKDGKAFTAGGPNLSNVDEICAAALGDSTEEELYDLALTSTARAFVYAMTHGQPFSPSMFPTDADLVYLKRCIQKYGPEREGWKGYL